MSTNFLLPAKPDRFREAEHILWSRLDAVGPQFAARKVRVQGSRALGVKYEKKVHQWFLHLYPKHYLPNPWFKFVDNNGLRWCQPDGLLIDAEQGLIVIVEIKHSHTGEAWWKLQKLYLQAVRALFGPNWTYRCVEVVRYFDASTLFPAADLCEYIHLAPVLPRTGVHIWNPQR